MYKKGLHTKINLNTWESSFLTLETVAWQNKTTLVCFFSSGGKSPTFNQN